MSSVTDACRMHAQAPEMFEGHSLSEKIDVYSFGILLWECFTGEVPWSDLDSPMQVSSADRFPAKHRRLWSFQAVSAKLLDTFQNLLRISR